MSRMPPPLDIPGFSKPSIDMQAVRDGRRAPIFQTLIDLSSARSIGAGSQLVIPLAGNSLYSDPLVDLSGNQIAGTVRVHLQNAELGPLQGAAGTLVGGAINTVQPGYNSRVPFTQLMIENYAQAGKFALLCYGMDIDFSPGAGQQVSILGTVSVNSRSIGQNYGTKFSSTATLAAAATEQVLAAASNVNGVIVHDAEWETSNGTAPVIGGSMALHAHTAAPAAYTDGDVLFGISTGYLDGTTRQASGALRQVLLVPAGKGLWFRNGSGVAETGANRKVLYTIL